MRILILLIIGFLVVMWFLHLTKSSRQRGQPHGAEEANPSLSSPETMVRCAQCGVYVPSSEAVTVADGQLSYCSDEHRLRHTG